MAYKDGETGSGGAWNRAALWVGGTLALESFAPADARLPTLGLQTLTGSPDALEGFKGRQIVVNLWATWCPPCRREMPVLQQAQQRRPDLHFVFLNQGEQAVSVTSVLESHAPALRNVLLDSNGEAGARLGHRALPTTLFFDAEGRLVDTRVGELSAATLADRLDTLAPISARKK